MLARRQALGARLGAQARALALGVGAGVGRLGVHAGRAGRACSRGACVGSARARWAGRAGARRASVLGRAGRACWGAQGGRRTGAGRRQQRAGAGRSGRAGAAAGAAGARGVRGLGAGRAAWALGARPGRWARGLGQLGARAPGLVSNLVFRLGIFPESPNGQNKIFPVHCKIKFLKNIYFKLIRTK